jgi:hypothetical protein
LTDARHADPELQAAYERCCATVTAPLPCRDPVYLAARHQYHKLLVARGMLAPRLAENCCGNRHTDTP